MKNLFIACIVFLSSACCVHVRRASIESESHFVVAGFSLDQTYYDRMELCETSNLRWSIERNTQRCSGAPEVFLGSLGESYTFNIGMIDGVAQGFSKADFQSVWSELVEQYGPALLSEIPSDGCLAQVETGVDTCLTYETYSYTWVKDGETLTVSLEPSGIARVHVASIL